MSKIKIETLTPIHIGSGNVLQYGTDFVYYKNNDYPYLGVIDDKKILGLIGEENIEKWVQSIERKEETTDLVKRYAPHAKVDDFTKRKIYNFADQVKSTDTLKECIHNGLGHPYIPGSSIKGAIRTAILSTLSKNVSGKESKIILGKDRNGNNRVSATKIEKELFGKEPNTDIFRFLQVGDVYFKKDVEISTRVVNLNIRNRQEFWDTSKPQLIEAIGHDESSSFEIRINNRLYDMAKGTIGEMPEEMKSLSSLFSTINLHTSKLIEEEIEHWTQYNEDDDVHEYIEKMKEMLENTQQDECKKGKSCILRLGHASGWRFITGGWAEKLNNFESDVVPAARPNNKRYSEYVFPKSRRVDEYCDLLGFLKLSMSESKSI